MAADTRIRFSFLVCFRFCLSGVLHWAEILVPSISKMVAVTLLIFQSETIRQVHGVSAQIDLTLTLTPLS